MESVSPMHPTPADWRITQRRDSYKSFFLTYEEPGSRLDLYFEMAGPGVGYGWVGGIEAFASWTFPTGVPIPEEHGQTIRERVESWARAHQLSIGFAPPITEQDWRNRLTARCYIAETLPDGSIRYSLSKRRRVIHWLRRLFRKGGPVTRNRPTSIVSCEPDSPVCMAVGLRRTTGGRRSAAATGGL